MIEIVETMFLDFGPMVNLEMYVALIIGLAIFLLIFIHRGSK